MPPELDVALLDFEVWWEAEFGSEKYLAALATLTDERREFVADSETPAAAHPRYNGWRLGAEEFLGQAPETPVAEFHDAVTAGTDAIRSRIRLDEDVARLHGRWRQHGEDAQRKRGNILSRATARRRWFPRWSGFRRMNYPQPMQRLAAEFGEFREARERVRRLIETTARMAKRRADLLERALTGGLPLSEVPGHDAWTAEAERLAE